MRIKCGENSHKDHSSAASLALELDAQRIPIATNSRKWPSLLSYQFSKIANVSESNYNIWNLLQATTSRKRPWSLLEPKVSLIRWIIRCCNNSAILDRRWYFTMTSTVFFFLQIGFHINKAFETLGKSLQLPYVNEAKFWLKMVLALIKRPPPINKRLRKVRLYFEPCAGPGKRVKRGRTGVFSNKLKVHKNKKRNRKNVAEQCISIFNLPAYPVPNENKEIKT